MNATQPRITGPTLRVMGAIASGGGRVWGAAITKTTGVRPGTLYAMLARLEAAGWVTARTEVGDPAALGRPQRRLYALTVAGAAAAARALEQVRASFATADRQARAPATDADAHKIRDGSEVTR